MITLDVELQAALAGDHTPMVRISALAPGLVVLASWEGSAGILLSGSVVFDRTRQVRRTASVTVADPTGALSPQGPGDYFFRDALWRLERGAMLSSGPRYVTLATLAVAGFDSSMHGVLGLTGEDPLRFLSQPLGAVTSVEQGMSAADALAFLWEPVLGPLVGTADTWDLDDAGRTVPARAWGEEDERLTAGTSLMADLGLQAFAGRDGIPVLRPIPDPTTQAPARSFAPPSLATITDLTRSGSGRLYNHFVAVGDNPNGPPVRAEASITDTASPLHESKIGVQRAPYYHSAQIADLASAFAVATANLIDLSLLTDGVNGSAIPDLRLDEDDVADMIERTSGTMGRYRLDQITHPLMAAAMTFVGTKTQSLFS